MRIAILEDDSDQLALLKRWLAEDGHDVHGYTSGRDAMKYAGRESFDLFVLEGESPLAREPRDVEEFTGEDIIKALADADQLAKVA